MNVSYIGTSSATEQIWQFGDAAEPLSVKINGALSVNESEVARRAALAGHGIARMAGLHAADDIREGRLVQVLTDYRTVPVPISLVYPSRRHLAPRTRVVMEFLADQIAQAKTIIEGDRREHVLSVVE